ncbi:MAG TPA: hypothetical protein H9825_09250 [Candidatus Sphingobacterium stercorigallinarum]|nr:hypothetical protein [Candidatus Sphingobacterium stercorigallinarum]
MRNTLRIAIWLVLLSGYGVAESQGDTPNQMTANESLRQLDTVKERNILFAGIPYRVASEAERVSAIIDENWYELDRSGSIDFFVLNPAGFRVENEAEDSCSGLPTEKLIGGFGEHTLLFLNLPGLFTGSVKDYPLEKGVLMVGDRVVFGTDDAYRLEASGTDFRDIDQGRTGSFYLDFFQNGAFVQRLIDQSDYNDSKTEVLRILDLNDDDQPDFMISSPRHYEEHHIVIWLSGHNGYTKYEETLSFGC